MPPLLLRLLLALVLLKKASERARRERKGRSHILLKAPVEKSKMSIASHLGVVFFLL